MTGGSARTVVFLLGPPGAGKTTFALALASRLQGAVLLSSQAIRTDLEALDLISLEQKRLITREMGRRLDLQLLLAAPVVVDMNLFLKFQRTELLQICGRHNVTPVIFVFRAERHVLIERIERKLAGDPVYASLRMPASEYLRAVEALMEDLEDDELFQAVVDVDSAHRLTCRIGGLAPDLQAGINPLLANRPLPSTQGEGAKETVQADKIVYRTPKFDVIESAILTSEGRPEQRWYVQKREFVGVILVDPAGLVLVTREFRGASAASAWGIPGGAREEGESREDAARRELFEETGLRVGRLTLLYTEPVVSASIIETNTLFVATGVIRARVVPPDSSRIEFKWLSYDDVLLLLLTERFQDKVLSALLRYLGPWIRERMWSRTTRVG